MTWMDRMVAVCALALALAAAACDGSAKRPATLSDDIFGDAGDPVGFATAEQRLAFERGRRVALRRFAPDEGFGPQFNVASCAACHEKPVIGGAGGRYRNFLLVFQRLDSGVFAGVGTNGVQNQFTIATNARVPTAEGAEVVATRNPIPFFGVGLLAEIPEAEILRRADPEDADGDGISGRANVDRELVGRFGRKAQTLPENRLPCPALTERSRPRAPALAAAPALGSPARRVAPAGARDPLRSQPNATQPDPIGQSMVASSSNIATRIRVGCAGLPPRTGRERYFERLPFLELDAMYAQPVKVAALRKWRKEAPEGAGFSLVAPRVLGERSFRDGDDVREARERLLEAADVLEAEVVLLRTAPEFSPSAANRAALREFVDALRPALGEQRALAWEPRGIWEPTAARAFGAELGLAVVEDPLARDPLAEGATLLPEVAYLRLTGLGTARRHFPGDLLEDLADIVRECERAWVVFANLEAFKDAAKFLKMLER